MISNKSKPRSESATVAHSISHHLTTIKPHSEAYLGPPIVTACAWAIHDGRSGDLLWAKQEDEKREMASLTKMMTCFVVCNIIKTYDIDIEDTKYSVNRYAAMISGTHSGLKEGDRICIRELLYGMMLPSGNDCALLLSSIFGDILFKHYKKNRAEESTTPVNPVKEFVKEMNRTAIKYSLKSTSFANPHGLSEKGNKSTVADLGRLACYAMQHPLIQAIAMTKTYEATTVEDARGNTRSLTWTNTNKLLDQGFCGLKTGNTPNAGPCLCLCSKDDDDDSFIVLTLLGSKTSEHRWQEALKLANWFSGKLKVVKSEMEMRSKTSSIKFRTRIIAGICKQL